MLDRTVWSPAWHGRQQHPDLGAEGTLQPNLKLCMLCACSHRGAIAIVFGALYYKVVRSGRNAARAKSVKHAKPAVTPSV